MELYQLLPDFRAESEEWIEAMEDTLLYLEDAPGCRAAISSLLLNAISLRESAGLFGLDRVIALTTAMEDVLVGAYKGSIAADEYMVTLLLSCCKHLKTLIGQTSSDWNGTPWSRNGAVEDDLLDQLKSLESKPLHDGGRWNTNVPGSPVLLAAGRESLAVFAIGLQSANYR